jgi:hypothetical protein
MIDIDYDSPQPKAGESHLCNQKIRDWNLSPGTAVLAATIRRLPMSIMRSALAMAVLVAGTAFVAPASAQDVELRIGPNGVRPVIRDRDRGCSAREARAAAIEEGLRRPQVVRITERSVTVEGFTRRGPERIRFANRRGCPII